ncbi:Magnesium transport protein corA, putative [Entamoeba invadens IP1]|uniref:Magnesium transport protein corA, putative n=1 Tax=Entamoeba invadens IP1 TaxID=370355 RepID=UPI0002C3F92A|nr:Magnesium transport protein corA, putative [Entamoeba invadens IP1]ELP85327.1 Magnesium transport protein corA, putative [Entamoeba invadens IP1]|eukprot:XP_004184673.1 Magnesium transport protein corA, putative [Entamoeba invadens IP1]
MITNIQDTNAISLHCIDDYTSKNRGESFHRCTLTVSGQGNCNRQVTIEELIRLYPKLIPAQGEDHDIWVDVCGNNQEDLVKIGELFHIHPLTVDDWLSDIPQSKSTIFETYYEVSDKELVYLPDTNVLDTISVNITMRDTFVLTVHPKPLFAIRRVMDKVLLHYSDALPSAQWVMYAILIDIIKGYKSNMDAIENDLDSVDKLAEFSITTDQNALLARLVNLKKRASNLDYQITPKRALLKYLIKTPTPKISKMVKIYLRDVLEEAASTVKRVDFVNDKIDDLTKTFMSRMTLDSFRVNRNQEELMKKFAIITTLFTPLIFASTAFGMNVVVPGQNYENLWMFGGFYFLSFLWMIAGMLYFKFTRWV